MKPVRPGAKSKGDAPGDRRDAPEALLLPPQLRAALRAELGPAPVDRVRMRDNLFQALSAGTLPASLEPVNHAMAARAAGVKTAGLKLGAGAVGHALASKVIVATLVVAGTAGVATLTMPRFAAKPAQVAVAGAHPRVRARDSMPPSAAAEKTAPQPPAVPIAEPAASPVAGPAAEPAANVAAPSAARAPRPRKASGIVLQPRAAARGETAVPVASERPAEQTSPKPQPSAAVEAAPAEPAPAVRSPDDNAVARAPLQGPAPAAANAPLPLGHNIAFGPELGLVRSASAALERHDYATAQSLLASYATRYPNGSLRIEAQALRVVAACETRGSHARSARDAFLREHGSSTLSARVRSACREIE